VVIIVVEEEEGRRIIYEALRKEALANGSS